MRLIASKSIRRLCVAVMLPGALVLVLFHAAGYLHVCKYLWGMAAMGEVNRYEVRSGLLMRAMDYVGVPEPGEAVSVWAEGLMKRSAALQYAVMSEQLRQAYAEQLEGTSPNWVTGMSSPWVESYLVVATQNPDADTYVFVLCLSTMTSTGPAGDYQATLTVGREEGFWRITGISADQGLNAYRGL